LPHHGEITRCRRPPARKKDRQKTGSFTPPPSPGHQASRLPPGTTAGFRGRTGSGHTASLPATTSAVPTSRGAGVRAEYTAPVLVVAESVSLKPVAGASSVNSRLPRPTVKGRPAAGTRRSGRPGNLASWPRGRHVRLLLGCLG